MRMLSYKSYFVNIYLRFEFISKMEWIYLLNDDCIQNFQLGNYCIYFKILYSSKRLFSNLKYLSRVNFEWCECNYCDIFTEKIPLFENLTYLDILSRYKYFDIQQYYNLYFEEHNHCPSLQILKSKRIYNLLSINLYTNLVKLYLSQYNSIAFEQLNALSKLTCVKSAYEKYHEFVCFEHFSNIKILKCVYYNLLDQYINYNAYVNLEILTLNFSRKTYNDDLYLDINCFNLTFLKIIGFDHNEIPKISANLNNLKRLKHLNLSCVKIMNDVDYFQNASVLNTLQLNGGSNLTLSNKYNYNLKHLRLEYFEDVTLDGMINLKTNKLKSIKKLTLDNCSGIKMELI